jgi:hypothetical protein
MIAPFTKMRFASILWYQGALRFNLYVLLSFSKASVLTLHPPLGPPGLFEGESNANAGLKYSW